MKYFSYVISRDYGFAPNPFHGICTLATCKPVIRKQAKVGDWIFGTGSVALGCRNYLIYAMKVTQKITYNEYWMNVKYKRKRPLMNGSLVQMYGDNIYHKNDADKWLQADSHHSNADGTINYYNLNRDIGSSFVLISDAFYYFGKSYIKIPENLITEVCKRGPGFRYVEDEHAHALIKILEDNYSTGYHGDPIQFVPKEHFIRHDGIKS